MSRTELLRKNSRRLFWGKALIEINILNAVVTLFYLHRGVTIDQIFYLSIVWSIATLVFEVPTGYLADRFGRKRTLILGAFFLALSWGVTLFAESFGAFVGIFVLMSASFSCFSGTEEALLYDSLQELGEEKQMTKHNGRLHSAQHLFNIFIPAIGAWIAADLLEWQFLALITINIVTTLGGGLIFFSLIEPRHVKNVMAQEKGIFRESLETIKGQPFLLRAAMNKLLIFIASFLVWRAYQPFLSMHGVGVVWLGIFYFLLHGTVFLVHQNIGKIEKRFGLTRILSGTIIAMIVSLVLVFITTQPLVLFVATLFAIVVTTVRAPVFGHAMNRLINSRSRATTLSNLNVFKAMLDIPVLLLSGWLAKEHLSYVFVIPIILGVITLLFFSPIIQESKTR